jgi:hypothetical protein
MADKKILFPATGTVVGIRPPFPSPALPWFLKVLAQVLNEQVRGGGLSALPSFSLQRQQTSGNH